MRGEDTAVGKLAEDGRTVLTWHCKGEGRMGIVIDEAAEVKGDSPFIGFVGLHYHDFPASFTPCIEIGWRLAFPHWGKGDVFEAAFRFLHLAVEELHLKVVFSLTAMHNTRSIKLMQKLGLKFCTDFNHPHLPSDHRLSQHVLYRSTV